MSSAKRGSEVNGSPSLSPWQRINKERGQPCGMQWRHHGQHQAGVGAPAMHDHDHGRHIDTGSRHEPCKQGFLIGARKANRGRCKPQVRRGSLVSQPRRAESAQDECMGARAATIAALRTRAAVTSIRACAPSPAATGSRSRLENLRDAAVFDMEDGHEAGTARQVGHRSRLTCQCHREGKFTQLWQRKHPRDHRRHGADVRHIDKPRTLQSALGLRTQHLDDEIAGGLFGREDQNLCCGADHHWLVELVTEFEPRKFRTRLQRSRAQPQRNQRQRGAKGAARNQRNRSLHENPGKKKTGWQFA